MNYRKCYDGLAAGSKATTANGQLHDSETSRKLLVSGMLMEAEG